MRNPKLVMDLKSDIDSKNVGVRTNNPAVAEVVHNSMDEHGLPKAQSVKLDGLLAKDTRWGMHQ